MIATKVNKINFFKNKEKIISNILLIVTFVISWNIIKDYGVTLDDEIYYLNAINTYNYIKNVFLIINNNDLNIDFYRDKLKEWPIIFEVFLVFLCDIFNITKIENIYLMSHQLNFIVFFIGLFTFSKLIKKRFNNNYFSFISIIFYIISPRIFAESFFNSRDIFFMSLFIFWAYSAFQLLEKKNYSNIIKFSLFSALLINTKILGIIPLGIFCICYIYNFLNTKEKFFNDRKNITLFMCMTIISIYIFWPFLWNNPIINLYEAFKNILVVHEGLVVINYYIGEYVASNNTPWHYRIVWFLITTPIIVVFLFLYGFTYICIKGVKILTKTLKNKHDFNNKDFYDFFLLFIFILSFFVVIEFNNSKFGGWRHLYFLYPIVVYFSIHSLNLIFQKRIKRPLKIFIIFSIVINSLYNFIWVYKNHPHQYLYFNLLNKKYFMNNFDLDYWGVTHKTMINYILNKDNNEKIKISTKGFTDLRNSYLYLDKKDKSRVVITGIKDAKYIIDNKMKRVRDYEKIDKNIFSEYYILKIDDFPISKIYKRKDQ
jgi:hypothetical protein